MARVTELDRSNSDHLETCFRALCAGREPLRWQRRLYQRLVSADVPATVTLPTGLGKTSVIPLWLIALAHAAPNALPRRLVYIVNRRTVVDQATDDAKRIREVLEHPEKAGEHEGAVCRLRDALAKLSGEPAVLPLAISTLRGEFADNGEWKDNPARPAIIVGTIDMIGSKLLFSGYGDGRYGRAHHAGLIGQDSLIVHDEAHLTPAFSSLLWSVERHGRETREQRAVYIMELSATSRAAETQDRARAIRLRPRNSQQGDDDLFELLAEDEQDQFVRDRLDAVKRLHLHELTAADAGGDDSEVANNDKKPKLEDALASLARAHDDDHARVLMYVRSPADAQKVAEALRRKLADAADKQIALLTGTVRGHERDQLLQQPPPGTQARIVRQFLDATRPERTVYLVSTSAGEVGIDLDADHMVCNMTTLDSLIQRLGRVNRRGGQGREARVDVVWTEEDSEPGEKASVMDKAVEATLRILQQGEHESPGGVLVSPRRLREMVEAASADQRESAFSPKGAIASLTDILLDNWSLTSIDTMSGRPEVAAYLHGLTADPPETYVAWRKEVTALHEAQVDTEALRQWFAGCRIEPRERLRDNTNRVRNALEQLLREHQKRKGKQGKAPDDFPLVLLDERGRTAWSSLSAIVKKPERNESDVLRYRTVVLPVEVGGLNGYGMLDPKAVETRDGIDVAEEATERATVRRQRWLCISPSEGGRFQRLLNGETTDQLPEALRERERVTLKEPPEGAEHECEARDLILLTGPGEAAVESPETAKFRQTLEDHTRQIADHMERITNALSLPDAVRDALVCAARWHDRGKDRWTTWQYYARNEPGSEPLAKCPRARQWRVLGGYRHEFGSLLEAMNDQGLREHAQRHLILHLIAAHHGWARPHFEARAYDHEGTCDPTTGERRAPTTAENEQAAAETLQRFARLQQRFGRWGLAWLESLLRCADIVASKQAAESRPGAGPTSPPQPQEAEA